MLYTGAHAALDLKSSSLSALPIELFVDQIRLNSYASQAAFSK